MIFRKKSGIRKFFLCLLPVPKTPMKSNPLSEKQMIRLLSKADERALKWFFDTYHRRIYQFALRFLKDELWSEEVVQDTFLSLWLHREKLNVNQPITPYLFTIARRNVIDIYRKRLASDKVLLEAQHRVTLAQEGTEDQILQQDVEKLLAEVMHLLTNQQRLAFRLSRVDGLSYDEIATEMCISKNTVKQHLVGALKTMRAYFSKHDLLYLFLLYFILD